MSSLTILIALAARNSEYNPKRFAALIMRIRQPRTTALIFRCDRNYLPLEKTPSEHWQSTAQK